MRINGDMVTVNSYPAFSPDVVKSMLYSVMTENQRTIFERGDELDFALAFSDNMPSRQCV